MANQLNQLTEKNATVRNISMLDSGDIVVGTPTFTCDRKWRNTSVVLTMRLLSSMLIGCNASPTPFSIGTEFSAVLS